MLTEFSIKNRIIKRQNRPDTSKMTNELVQHKLVEESTSIQWVNVSEMKTVELSSSVDPDEAAQIKPSYLDLYCLPLKPSYLDLYCLPSNLLFSVSYRLGETLHGPSVFAVKAKIYGVIYNQSSSIAFDETSSYWSAQKRLLISRLFIGHRTVDWFLLVSIS